MPSGTSHTLTHTHPSNWAEGQQAQELPPGQNAAPLLTCSVIPNDGHHDDIEQEPEQEKHLPCGLTASEAGRTHQFYQ